MKQIKLLALALVALAFTLCGQAQTYYDLVPYYANSTNFVASASTNSSIAVVIPVVKGSTCAVQPTFKLDGAGTTAVVFKFDASVDGSTWEANVFSSTVTPAGTAVVGSTDIFTLGSIGYIRLNVAENPNSAGITNLTVWVSQKRGI